MKKELLILAIFLMGIASVFAQESPDKEIEAGKSLVESKKACEELNNEQLESIGDYYMEQMHPGEAHEIMDNMMGGEGSSSLKQVHISMAKRLYCNEDVYIGYGMMGNYNGRGMMGYGQGFGMMGTRYGMMGPGMMYGYGSYGIFNALVWIAIVAAATLLMVWLIRRNRSPLEALKLRYARGEITKKRYGEMKREIDR